MQTNECPCCRSNLEIKQINFEEAVLICMNLKCPYPLDGKVKIYKRKLKGLNLNSLSLCKDIRNGTDNNNREKSDIIRKSTLHEVSTIPNETVTTPEYRSSTNHMTDFEYHIVEGNNFQNQEEDSEAVVNVIIEEANHTNNDGENSSYDVLEIEVEIDSVSQEVILKKVQDHPNINDERLTSNSDCMKEIKNTDLAPEDDIDSLIDAKIDELLKDADMSSIASIETMSEDIDWLNELLEL